METLSGARETRHLAQPTTVTGGSPDEEAMPQTPGRYHLETRGSERPGISWLVSFGTVISYTGLLIVLAVWAGCSLANMERRQVPHVTAGGPT